MRASGVRSSCESSAVSRCSWRRLAARRSSSASSVAPSRVSSSYGSPRSKRRSMSCSLHAGGVLRHPRNGQQGLAEDPAGDDEPDGEEREREDERGDEPGSLRLVVGVERDRGDDGAVAAAAAEDRQRVEAGVVLGERARRAAGERLGRLLEPLFARGRSSTRGPAKIQVCPATRPSGGNSGAVSVPLRTTSAASSTWAWARASAVASEASRLLSSSENPISPATRATASAPPTASSSLDRTPSRRVCLLIAASSRSRGRS